jgi:arylsulfatase A-like enzyme
MRCGLRLALLAGLLACSNGAGKPNVLFIAVDDLRPQLNAYGKDFMHTPNVDRLAGRGVLFERAYCMVPTCGASRASLMSGIRPAPGRFISYTSRADRDVPKATTLNTHFKQQGYTTISLGKVFHNAADNAHGWSKPPWRSTGPGYQDREAERAAIAAHKKRYPKRRRVRGGAFEAVDAPDAGYPDAETARVAIQHLEGFARDRDQPFFLAVGFLKPHLPFVAPKKYWDLYDFDRVQLPDNYYAPKDAPAVAMHSSGELRSYAGIPPQGPVDALTARKLIHGYYACVSFIDAQLGRLIDALERLELHDHTIIVLWGDHGWQLGEHLMWNKHSCFETSMHAPLMIAAPGLRGVKPGTRVSALVEFIDIYPGLCELAGLPQPKHLEGRSLVPLMKDPGAPWKKHAVGRFKQGDTVRTDRYRYSEYRKNDQLIGHMLYDHEKDPGENRNISGSPENQSLVQGLGKVLDRIKGR